MATRDGQGVFDTRKAVAELVGLTLEARDAADRVLKAMLYDHDFPKPVRVTATRRGGVRAVWDIDFPAYRSVLTVAVSPSGRCTVRTERTSHVEGTR